MTVYKMTCEDSPPVYKETAREAHDWVKRHEDKCITWEKVDVIKELNKLQGRIADLQQDVVLI